MAAKFKSEYFKDVLQLVQAKDDAWRGVDKRRKRLDIVRKFSNGLATMTLEEAEAQGVTEIVNHLITYSKLQNQGAMFESMVTGVKNLVEVIVDTDDPEADMVMGERVSEALNRGAFSRKGKFARFWKTGVGEIIMAGGGPATLGARYGWLPKLEMDMFFPKETSLDADDMTYSFVPQEMTLRDLELLKEEVDDGEASVINVKNVKKLIEILEKRIEDAQSDTAREFTQEKTKAARDDGTGDNLTIDCWFYFEVKTKKDGTRFVSKTLFTTTLDTTLTKDEQADFTRGNNDNKEPSSSSFVISYVKDAYKEASDWLSMICIDSEIGGEKNMETLRGVAELIYPSSADMEDLFNRMMEGDKIRATPKMRVTSAADADAVGQWDINSDLFIPEGVEEAQFNSTAVNLQSPINDLQGVVSSITGAPMSNSSQGGELRQQAIERQESNAGVRSNRLSEAYDVLDSILEVCVFRLLGGETKAGAEGHQETMWVRNSLKKYEIDPKLLSEREFGQFKHIRVRAKRSIGNGDRQHQLQTSDWLMDKIQNYPPASRPLILREATQLRTQDTDLAERLVKVPQTIINSQKLTAENEYDTITRRAALGQNISVAEEDIHQEHFPVHMVDSQALIARDQYQPWTKLDALGFGGMLDHLGEHLQILLGNPDTNFEGQQFLQDYQALAQASRPIFQRLEQDEQEAQQVPLSQKDEAELELKRKAEERKWVELGIRSEDLNNLEDIRKSRANLSRRTQFAKEVSDDRRQSNEEKKARQETAGKVIDAKSTKQEPKK